MDASLDSKHSDHEDGEISDDEDDAPQEITSTNPKFTAQSSDDEEPSEDVIKAYTLKMAEKTEPIVEIDPKLCKVCLKEEHKYKCPRCEIRTCSLSCSKRHKTENECDGVRQAFASVEKLSQYDQQKSIEDQKFMYAMKEKAGLGVERCGVANEVTQVDNEDPNALRYSTNSPTERYLLNAARFRHIWLGFTDGSGNESRHEQHSDTIFWNVKITFRKQNSDGTIDTFEKTVLNIPETIRIVTVLKQFFKPRQYGCIVSEHELDVVKLAPFISRGVEDVNVHMEVHGRPDRFYGVVPSQTILETTRSRVVADFPKFVVTLNDEFVDGMVLMSTEELAAIQTKFGGVATNGGERFRGRGGGGRGFRGGGGRGGGHQNGFKKRPAHGGYEGGNAKRGRGGGGHQFNRRGGHHNRQSAPLDSFDPFEPFAGPTRLPMEYNS